MDRRLREDGGREDVGVNSVKSERGRERETDTWEREEELLLLFGRERGERRERERSGDERVACVLRHL